MGKGKGNLFTYTPFFLVSCWTPGLLTLSYKLSTWGTLIHPRYLLQRDRVRILAGRPDLHCATLPILCSSPALQPVVPPHSWSAQMGPRPKYRSRPEELRWSCWALSRIGQLHTALWGVTWKNECSMGDCWPGCSPTAVAFSPASPLAWPNWHVSRGARKLMKLRNIKACEPWGILQRWRSLESCSFGPL